MFELEQELGKWMTQLSKLDSVRDQDLEELESHLRDSIMALTSKDLTEEEAFLIATRRMGHPSAIEREFAKASQGHSWSRRMIAKTSGFAALVLVNLLGFCAIAWMLEYQVDGLQHRFGPLRAALDKQIVVEQNAFSPGMCSYYLPIDRFESVGHLVEEVESTLMKHYVPPGSYAKQWVLVGRNGSILSRNPGQRDLADAGISPGVVLRVVSVEDGRITINGAVGTIVRQSSGSDPS